MVLIKEYEIHLVSCGTLRSTNHIEVFFISGYEHFVLSDDRSVCLLGNKMFENYQNFKKTCFVNFLTTGRDRSNHLEPILINFEEFNLTDMILYILCIFINTGSNQYRFLQIF